MEAHRENRTFGSGAVRDGGKKPALHLISPHAMNRLGEWLRVACEDRVPPYPERNWEKGMPFGATVASLQRHVEKLKLGSRAEDHVAAILFGAMALAHYQEEIAVGRMDSALDDLPHYEDRAKPWPPRQPGTGGGPDVVLVRDGIQAAVGRSPRMIDHFGQGRTPVPGDVDFEAPESVAVTDLALKPFTVYLCGPITGQRIDYQWRELARVVLLARGIETLDPLRGKHPKDVSNQGLSYKGQLAAPEIAERDRMDIEKADAILAHFPYEPSRQSIGSWMEIGFAAMGLKKSVVLCSAIQAHNDHLFCRNFCIMEPRFPKALQVIADWARQIQTNGRIE